MRAFPWTRHAAWISCLVLAASSGCDMVKKLTGGTSEGETKEAVEKAIESAVAPKPNEGDACTGASATCKDASSMLECNGTKWELRQCRGKEGCKGTVVIQCDETIAKAGDPCGTEENFSCTEDLKTQLKCTAGKWQEASQCRGPKACETKFPFSKCDQSVAKEGDACPKDGNVACTEDKKAMIECKGGKYGSKKPCPKGCAAKGLFVECE